MLSFIFPNVVILAGLYSTTLGTPLTSIDNDDIGHFWQLTDVHLDLDYTPSKCGGMYGSNYSCDSSWDLVRSAIDAMHRFQPHPDFIIWSGDGGAHSANLSQERLQYTIQRISTYLYSKFPIYVLPSLGNHDVYPANNLSIDPQDLRRMAWCHRLASDEQLWGRWIHHAEQFHSNPTLQPPPPYANFSQGCFFSKPISIPYGKQQTTNLLLISVNGLIWYQDNTEVNSTADYLIPDPLGQFSWLQRTFEWARKNQWKVLLVSHFPPGASENTPRIFQFLHPSWNAEYVELLRDNADLLMAGLYAHTHVDSFKLLSDDQGNPIASLFTAPSIAPLHLRGLGSFNPRVRLYSYQRSTLNLLGYSQFYTNLSSSDAGIWKQEYNIRDAYNLTDLSPTSLRSLLRRFQHDSNRESGPWSRYWSHELGGRPHDPKPQFLTPDGFCPSAQSRCRCEHLCPMKFVDLTEIQSCLDACPSEYNPIKDSLDQGIESTGYPDIESHLLFEEVGDESFSSTAQPEAVREDAGGSNSLIIVAGVIVVFLSTLVGIVFCVNRGSCRRRKHHASRLPQMLFSNLANGGGSYHPRSGTSTLIVGQAKQDADVLSSSANISLDGSLTELSRSFHPQYFVDGDVNPLVTVRSTNSKRKPIPGCQNESNCAVKPPPSILPASSTPYNHHSNHIRPFSHGDTPFVNKSTPEVNDKGASNGQFSLVSMVSPTEEYYADDEAGELDSIDHSIALPNGDQTNGTPSDADDEDELGNFQLDYGRTPLTTTNNKSVKPNFKLMCPIPDESATVNVKLRPSSRQNPIKQSHSVTMGLNSSSSPFHPNKPQADDVDDPLDILSSRRFSLIDQHLTSAAVMINRLKTPSHEYVRM